MGEIKMNLELKNYPQKVGKCHKIRVVKIMAVSPKQNAKSRKQIDAELLTSRRI